MCAIAGTKPCFCICVLPFNIILLFCLFGCFFLKKSKVIWKQINLCYSLFGKSAVEWRSNGEKIKYVRFACLRTKSLWKRICCGNLSLAWGNRQQPHWGAGTLLGTVPPSLHRSMWGSCEALPASNREVKQNKPRHRKVVRQALKFWHWLIVQISSCWYTD